MKTLDEIKKIINLEIVAIREDDGLYGYWRDPLDQKCYSIVFSWGGGWEHLSVAPITKKNTTPSWELMCRLKDLFWNKNEVCVQYHPREEDYVDIHPHCLHIWKPINEEIPTPPKIYV